MIRKVAQQLRPLMRRPIRDLALLVVLAAIAGMAEAAVLVLVVDAAVSIADGSVGTPAELPIVGLDASVGQVLWIAAFLAIAVAIANTVVSVLSAKVGTEVLEVARHRAVEAFLAASWERQSTEREGSVQETATTLSFQASSLTMVMVGGLSSFLGLLALLLAAVLIDVVVTAIVLAFGLALFAAIRPIGELTRRAASAYVAANSRYSEHVARMATMSMEYKAFGVEPEMLMALDGENATVSAGLRRSRFLGRFGVTMYRDLAVLFLVAAVAALYAGDGGRIAEVGAVALLIVRSLGYATTVQTTLQQVSELSPNVFELNRRLELLEASSVPTGTTAVSSFAELRLDGVGYSYHGRAPAVHDVDLAIEAGDVLGVVGPSGSGKSTLLQLLLRLRLPEAGAVTVDGLDYRRIDPASWAGLVAIVPQEPRLMEASVADNIAFMRPGIDRERIEQAADDAHVGDEIRALPDGFDTRLGPQGSGLSGGQKQRVAFARALVGRPQLLVLDEPTSALDSVSERRIQETIVELKDRVTLVIVAHRVSTLDVCNRVISMKGGRIESAELPSA